MSEENKNNSNETTNSTNQGNESSNDKPNVNNIIRVSPRRIKENFSSKERKKSSGKKKND